VGHIESVGARVISSSWMRKSSSKSRVRANAPIDAIDTTR
jgi:hypothetical protein